MPHVNLGTPTAFTDGQVLTLKEYKFVIKLPCLKGGYMSRITLLLVLLGIALFQLVWLFNVWRRDGFVASFKLFFYGFLSSVCVGLQNLLGLS